MTTVVTTGAGGVAAVVAIAIEAPRTTAIRVRIVSVVAVASAIVTVPAAEGLTSALLAFPLLAVAPRAITIIPATVTILEDALGEDTKRVILGRCLTRRSDEEKRRDEHREGHVHLVEKNGRCH